MHHNEQHPSLEQQRRRIIEKIKTPLAHTAAVAFLLANGALGPTSDERTPIEPTNFDVNVVSMGDSLTAGPGILPYETGTGRSGDHCYRGATNYANEIAEKLGAKQSVNVACSGATVDEIRNGKNGNPSQLTALSADTDVVFLDAYLNDNVRFQYTFDQCKSSTGCDTDSAYYRSVKESINDSADIKNLAELYREVLEKAPNARVFIMEYPNVLGNPAVRFIAKQQAGDGIINIATMIIDQVNNATKQAVAEVNSDRLIILPSVDVGTNFFKPSDKRPEAVIHPTAKGQQKMAEESYPYVVASLRNRSIPHSNTPK